MLNKNERCKQATIHPKVQAIFVHILVNVILKHATSLIFKKKSNNNVGVFRHIKTYYRYYEIVKNGNLHIHTLLWLNDSPYLNTLIQTSRDDEFF